MRILKQASYYLVLLCVLSCKSNPSPSDYKEIFALNHNSELKIQTGIDLPITYSFTIKKTSFLVLDKTTRSIIVSIANNGSIEDPKVFLDTHSEHLQHLVKNKLSHYNHFDNIAINITEDDEIIIEVREVI